MGRPPIDYNTAFWTRVDKGENCWIWRGGKSSQRYGSFRNKLVHRYAYEYYHGSIPPNMTIDHLCNEKLCVNPSHLAVVTREENVLRGKTITAFNKKKTHCIRGHVFSIENVYHRPSKPHHRSCRKCQQQRERAYKWRKKVSLNVL